MKLPNLPLGRKVPRNKYPPIITTIYTGVSQPHTGQIATTVVRNEKNPMEADMCRMLGAATSISTQAGRTKVEYSVKEAKIAKLTKAKVLNTGLTREDSNITPKKLE
jgi:hypothetical protein